MNNIAVCCHYSHAFIRRHKIKKMLHLRDNVFISESYITNVKMKLQALLRDCLIIEKKICGIVSSFTAQLTNYVIPSFEQYDACRIDYLSVSVFTGFRRPERFLYIRELSDNEIEFEFVFRVDDHFLLVEIVAIIQ